MVAQAAYFLFGEFGGGIGKPFRRGFAKLRLKTTMAAAQNKEARCEDNSWPVCF
jgi:hypothetical protein